MNVICSDKTGTITCNQMTVTTVITACGDRVQVRTVRWYQAKNSIEESADLKLRGHHHDEVWYLLTVNAPLILIVREVTVFRGKHIIVIFAWFFEGAKIFCPERSEWQCWGSNPDQDMSLS